MKEFTEGTARAGKPLIRGLAAMIVATTFLMHASPVVAAVYCPPNPATGGVVAGNLEVPAYSTCTLDHVTVNGSVTVGAGGTLIATSTTIRGSLTALNPGSVSLTDGSVGGPATLGDSSSANSFACGTRFNGNVTIQGASGFSNTGSWQLGNACAGVFIGGTLNILNNTAYVFVANSTIQGNVNIHGSSGSAIVFVENSHIYGSLSESNNQSEVVNSNNQVNGRTTGDFF